MARRICDAEQCKMGGTEDGERLVIQAIREAQAQGFKKYVIKAWTYWGTPKEVHITATPASIASTLDPAIIFERAKSTLRAEILKLGYSATEADQAHYTFEAVEEGDP